MRHHQDHAEQHALPLHRSGYLQGLKGWFAFLAGEAIVQQMAALGNTGNSIGGWLLVEAPRMCVRKGSFVRDCLLFLEVHSILKHAPSPKHQDHAEQHALQLHRSAGLRSRGS